MMSLPGITSVCTRTEDCYLFTWIQEALPSLMYLLISSILVKETV